MKWLGAVVVVSLAACEQPADPYPINPGGGGGGTGSTKVDASLIADASPIIAGRVCLLRADPHTLTGCANSGAAGITVTLGTESTTTNVDGTFTMKRPEAASESLAWRVSAPDLKTSVIQFGAATTLPAIEAATYDEMVIALEATVTAGQGALMTRVTGSGSAVSGATVAASPPGDSIPYYDGPSELEWQTLQTGPYGVAWFPSLDPGTVQLTVTADQAQKSFAANPVVADAITFVFAEIP